MSGMALEGTQITMAAGGGLGRKLGDSSTLESIGALSDSDGDLLQRCRQGDEAAWRELVHRHTRRVFNLAYRFVGRVDEAEDLTQEIFVKVYQSLARYRADEGAFTTWLTTVARNQAIDNYRRRREERLRRTHDPEVLDIIPSGEEGPLRSLERQERVQLVHRGLRALPADLREPIVLCDLQGLPYEEAASVLGIPLGTVKSRINRGRIELAKRLLGRRHELAGRA
jgi:RNA polymerase sigma-70 factor (ECF subfamily)